MSSLYSLLLTRPLPDSLLRGLLFTAFTLHMLLVLLTLGTAILALSYFIHAWRGQRLHEWRWDKEILRTFLAHKSLAVVLGVASLLLIQVGWTIPFFTGVNLMAPFWIFIIPLLIIAFLFFDALGHQMEVHPFLHLVFGIVALASLLIVPGIFVAVLITVENPEVWVKIIKDGYQLRGSLSPYWLFRYLHVLGAAVVFGAAFHYLFSTRDETEKRRSLLTWVITGILIQFILGVLLYTSLLEKPDLVTNAFLILGMAGAGTLLWVIYFNLNKGVALTLKAAVPLFMLILVPMLLTRQFIQDRKLGPFEEKLQTSKVNYKRELEPYSKEALSRYQSDLMTVYDRGETIYPRSCAFCHGEDARGNGPEAKNLQIPPEDISAVRTTRAYFHRILAVGISGSAMPYFTYFDRNKIESLVEYLDKKYHVVGLPGPIPVQISYKALEQAKKIYAETCSACHGMDGKGTKLSGRFKPPPPDFTFYSLSPKRAFKVVTAGYPGTVMPPFSNLEEEVRWGLAEIVNGKRKMDLLE
jgi:mono/diheme cytochrome c family protein